MVLSEPLIDSSIPFPRQFDERAKSLALHQVPQIDCCRLSHGKGHPRRKGSPAAPEIWRGLNGLPPLPDNRLNPRHIDSYHLLNVAAIMMRGKINGRCVIRFYSLLAARKTAGGANNPGMQLQGSSWIQLGHLRNKVGTRLFRPEGFGGETFEASHSVALRSRNDEPACIKGQIDEAEFVSFFPSESFLTFDEW